MESVPF